MSLCNMLKELTNEIKSKKLIELKNIVQSYNIDEVEQHIRFDDQTYQRKTIYENKHVEFVVICWKKGQKSKIHDHPDKGCILRLHSGHLKETRYTHDLQNKAITYIRPDMTTYIDNIQGYHEVEALQDSVSLHIYSPPRYKCKKFN